MSYDCLYFVYNVVYMNIKVVIKSYIYIYIIEYFKYIKHYKYNFKLISLPTFYFKIEI